MHTLLTVALVCQEPQADTVEDDCSGAATDGQAKNVITHNPASNTAVSFMARPLITGHAIPASAYNGGPPIWTSQYQQDRIAATFGGETSGGERRYHMCLCDQA